MICQIELVTYDQPWRDLTEDQYAELCSVAPFPDRKADYYGNKVLVDLRIVAPLLERFRLKPTLSAFRNNQFTSMKDQQVQLEERCNELADEFRLVRQYQAGGVVQFHVPNIGLLAINEVELVSNGCTDDLQNRLDEGWSMLAVCPPNTQRRPDYIIGRHNPSRLRDK